MVVFPPLMARLEECSTVGKIACQSVSAWARRYSLPKTGVNALFGDLAHAPRRGSAPLPSLKLRAHRVIE
jgi:hypothetical protein